MRSAGPANSCDAETPAGVSTLTGIPAPLVDTVPLDSRAHQSEATMGDQAHADTVVEPVAPASSAEPAAIASDEALTNDGSNNNYQQEMLRTPMVMEHASAGTFDSPRFVQTIQLLILQLNILMMNRSRT